MLGALGIWIGVGVSLLMHCVKSKSSGMPRKPVFMIPTSHPLNLAFSLSSYLPGTGEARLAEKATMAKKMYRIVALIVSRVCVVWKKRVGDDEKAMTIVSVCDLFGWRAVVVKRMSMQLSDKRPVSGSKVWGRGGGTVELKYIKILYCKGRITSCDNVNRK